MQRITGKNERHGRKLLNKIREELSKEPHQFISIDEFCDFTGLAPAIVERYITD
ncbi:hypothetical protein [Cyclobacterium xiamenense]|uniref:hypothetical protein n=1 Tax=Cyclobacterium xiamenense TaxID=1297121 RepID=UPI0013A55CF1|nr:hypothetical protein [Cyclobacterium xiamenense]